MKVVIKRGGITLRTIEGASANVRKRLTDFAVAHDIRRGVANLLAWRVTEARQPTGVAAGMVAEVVE